MQFFRRNPIHPHRKPPAGDAAPMRRLRLLLVDENPVARAVVARRLSHLNYDVALAENGHVALGLLVTRPADIILIDMGLTLLPAVTTMEKMRAAHLAPSACVVMIGGREDGQSAIEALKAGADDHILKPFDFDLLDARLRHLCQRAEQVGTLNRHNAELDARIARRAVELGETRETLREMQADRARLVSSIQALQDEIARLQSARI
ncbi:MAG TPA: response regulator [Sphingobium sp.]|jgi:DNA-binding response OmpR family regulator|uniref:response regulator transcription factor n=1 Tax=unclassified Sphingobium TaxID=2611147 RepID=UPI0007F5129C|nr:MULTISPECIES: response regulator [unclassified Sphingobium]OAN55530.1 LuxR family transcriptional regulator [Sphingobium sp. TCM1]WIW88761.1 response regulator [Sphingobium sp. V4]HAF41571.1 response regulator [Sphingobium sp.]